ncbi:MAG TPA: UDP-4-amino-4,6-dideoxy-N-acetyl-beta-L-altrosamine N-acetyltransferase [Acidimicrobiia bacterium]|nr:UDP-4-amino-4,6-dideoxy-N-acetyl-beta-L-altrosamine N-acetyltransferase [Acidimicrobiia bacterium]
MRLRPMTLADADQVLAWRNRPEIANNMFDNRPIAHADHVRWTQRMLESPAHQYWIIEHDGRDIGVVNLAEIDIANSRCSWGFYIADPAARGPVGVAVELRVLEIVFGELGLEKLCSRVFAWNERTIALHERIGFVREGTLRSDVRRNDGVHDVVLLSMLRPEWEARYGHRVREHAS